MRKDRINDLILVLSVSAAAVILLLVINMASVNGATVKIEQNGALLETYSLNDNLEYDIYDKNGKICNTVSIDNGNVKVIYADCDDKICVNHKAISKSGESIICLPNKVVVSIENEKESEPDGVAR